jgi:hypothetical protein
LHVILLTFRHNFRKEAAKVLRGDITVYPAKILRGFEEFNLGCAESYV